MPGRRRLVPDPSTLPAHRPHLRNSRYFLFKPKPLVERYAELVEKLRPRNIFELGVFEGGARSSFRVGAARRLVAVDWGRRRSRRSQRVLAGHERREPALFDDVNQGPRRLREIADDAFGSDPLTWSSTISHLYEPTRASFNELFPRLRPGGSSPSRTGAGHAARRRRPEGNVAGRSPLTRLLFEMTLAIPSYPELIRNVRINLRTIEVTRGDAKVDPDSFDISGCCNAAGATS